MSENELHHYGRLGMKWYHHIFGDADARAKYSERGNPSSTKRLPPSEQERPKLNNKSIGRLAEKSSMARNAKSITESTKSITQSINRMKNISKQKDLSELSDDELRKMINRLSMEQQYSNLTTSKISRGQAYVEETLSMAGGALALTSSALMIAISIKKLKGG